MSFLPNPPLASLEEEPVSSSPPLPSANASLAHDAGLFTRQDQSSPSAQSIATSSVLDTADSSTLVTSSDPDTLASSTLITSSDTDSISSSILVNVSSPPPSLSDALSLSKEQPSRAHRNSNASIRTAITAIHTATPIASEGTSLANDITSRGNNGSSGPGVSFQTPHETNPASGDGSSSVDQDSAGPSVMGHISNWLKTTQQATTQHTNPNTNHGTVAKRNRRSRGADPRSHESNSSGNDTSDSLFDIRCELMANYLHHEQCQRMWASQQPGEGVVLKQSRGKYVCCPATLQTDGTGFFQAVSAMKVLVACTVNTPVIGLLLDQISEPFIEIAPGVRVQVVPNVSALPHCQLHQQAAFIASPKRLVVWDDDAKLVISRATKLQEGLLALIWESQTSLLRHPDNNDKRASIFSLFPRPWEPAQETAGPEEEHQQKGPRGTVLIQPCVCAVTLILMFGALGFGFRRVAIEIYVDQNWFRLCFLLTIIPQSWLSLFFFQALVGNLIQLMGPVSQTRKNTRFYSGVAPRRLDRRYTVLPHVTIQMPVFKEGLQHVIGPTVLSLKSAISTYELQGGTANIFINDDGMQLLSQEEAQARQDFYDEHGIGWVARPPHNPKPVDGQRAFHRRGKFKKASNLNYAMWASVLVEEKLSKVERPPGWNQHDEKDAYNKCLEIVLGGQNGDMWAEGNIRIGDYILMVDSDTRVPRDCLLDAVSEMEQSPQVAVLQYTSGVMNVTESFFERGITFFTNMIYHQIKFAVACGDVAPFVGHNAVVRWSAIQEVSYHCDLDNREKFWSEETVSEDFDMALRLHALGYHVRLATYKGEEKDNAYLEGVSLTVYDELARWEKYAYGCSELLFHPFKHWFTKGPFTTLFYRFVGSEMPIGSKITIVSYIGTYYALASAWIMCTANYFLTGWFNGYLDHFYVDSFKVYFSIMVVFTALGNVAYAMLRRRQEAHHPLWAFVENVRWIPMLFIFLGGVSIHISQALVFHLCSINMTWGATAKEIEQFTFFEEIPRVVRRFKFTFLWCLVCAAVMIVLASDLVNTFWQISFFTPIWPLATGVVCHFLLPIALNPNLMMFTW